MFCDCLFGGVSWTASGQHSNIDGERSQYKKISMNQQPAWHKSFVTVIIRRQQLMLMLMLMLTLIADGNGDAATSTERDT